MKINELKINNLRCFCEAKSEIRPITVIVGENNTGKTTFLSTYKLVHDLLYEDKPIKPSSIEDVLKERSYQYLGGSAHITRKPGNTDIINMGAQFTVGSQDVWNVEYSIQEGRYCRKILMSCLQDTIEVNLKEGHTMEVLVNGQKEYNSTIPVHFSIHFFGVISFLYNELKSVLDKNKHLYSKIASLIKEKEQLKNTICHFIEPVHLKPKNQYDPMKIQTKDSSYVLSKVAEIKQTKNWSKISREFNDFGKEAKLFQKLDILKQGKHKNSSFSIQVTVDDLKSDITNVGYGVSQFLPVLSNVLLADENKHNTFLMQQPETHLHPRVEAEITTLMVKMVNKYKNKYRFVCETHSDYIIQRARIKIKEQILNPEDFLILYFELKNGEAKIHPVTVDSNGNIKNQPKGYQTFFLTEDYKLLGLKDESS